MYNNILTISNTINSISKGIGLINRILPLYEQAKPMINNAKKIITFINDKSIKNKTTIEINDNKKNTSNNYSNPVFFQ